MDSSVVTHADLGRLTPAKVWAEMDADTRLLAARALYSREHDDTDARDEADEAVAEAIRFRTASVKKLPLEKRARHLARAVRPDDSLATALLITLHVVNRRDMLAAFLHRLDIPHDDGIIDQEEDYAPPDAEALSHAAQELIKRFPRPNVELYLTSLVAMDPDTWGALADVTLP